MFRIKMFLFLVPSFFNSKLSNVLREALESSVVMNSITHFSLIYFITITFFLQLQFAFAGFVKKNPIANLKLFFNFHQDRHVA